MNLVGIRDALVTRLNANWPSTYSGVPLFYENTQEVDLDKVGDAFLRCAVLINAAEQISVELAPTHRTRGRLEFRVYVKAELGTRVALGYLDYLTTLFKLGNYSGVHTKIPEPVPGQSYKGWYSLGLSVPFWADSNI